MASLSQLKWIQTSKQTTQHIKSGEQLIFWNLQILGYEMFQNILYSDIYIFIELKDNK